MQLISNYTTYRKITFWFFYTGKIFRYTKLFSYGTPFVQTEVNHTTFNCWINGGELQKLSK